MDEKNSAKTTGTDITLEEVTVPRQSLADVKTWLGLLNNLENIRYATRTVFKISRKYFIETVCNIEPLFLYDNIILGMSGDKLAFLYGRKFMYAENQLLLEAIKRKGYGLAKSVFSTSVAGYIFDELEMRYGKNLMLMNFAI